MNWLFRRHFWIIHLLFLSIATVITAKTAGVLVGYWLVKSVPDKPLRKIMNLQEEEIEENDYDLVSEQNLFSARREDLTFDDLESKESDHDPGDWRDASPSRLPLKLISTMVFEDPYKSNAEIINVSTSVSELYSINECVPYKKINDPNIETVLPPSSWIPNLECNRIENLAEVVRIEENRVYILNFSSGYEYLDLGNEKKQFKPVQVADEKYDEGSGIRKVGEHSYQIEQRAFDKALSNLAQLSLDARAVPVTGDKGNFEGFKLLHIKKDSLFEKIGLKASDTLKRINGYELSDPQKALELFGKLRFQDRFTVEVIRNDKPTTLDYSVVP